MPCSCGESLCSALRPILPRPSARRVPRWRWDWPMRAADLRDLQSAHAGASSGSATAASARRAAACSALLRARCASKPADLGDRLSAERRDVLRTDEALEAVDGRPGHVDRRRRAEALREHVADAGELEHRACAAAGDHAGSLARGAQDDPCGVEPADDLVRDRLPVLRHGEEVLAGVLDRLRDRERHLARLPVAEPDAIDLVADDDERGEREAPAALHDLRDAVDLDDPLLELAGLTLSDMLKTRVLLRGRPRRGPSPVRGTGSRRDRTRSLDARLLRRFGERLADGGRLLGLRAGAAQPFQLADASVRRPRRRSSWAEIPRFERNTARRGRSAVPATLPRTRRWRRSRASRFVRTLMLASRPSCEPARRGSGCPCPCTARAGAPCGSRRPSGRPSACRSP